MGADRDFVLTPEASASVHIGVESGLAAIVDAGQVNDLLQGASEILDGSEVMPHPGVVRTGPGLICGTVGDGMVRISVRADDTYTTALRLDLHDGDCGENA